MPLCKDVRALRTGVRGTYVDPYMSMRLPRTQRGKGKEKKNKNKNKKQSTKNEDQNDRQMASC
jgi:hypothetical protein